MDLTLQGVMDRVQRDSSLQSRGPVYTLASQHAQGATTVHLNETPAHVGPGSVASMNVSSYYIQSADQQNKTLTVIPNYHGTVDDTHNPPMIVSIDDPMPGGAIMDHALKEVLSWRKQLWQVKRINTITTIRTQKTYGWPVANEPVLFLLDVRRAPALSGDISMGWLNWSWRDDRYPHVRTKLVRNNNDVAFPNQLSLQLDTPPPEGRLYVAYATPFVTTAWTAATDLVSTVGLKTEWIEILDAGVRARALQAGIAARADWRRGGHAREAEQVTLLDMVRAAQTAKAERDEALADAAVALRAEWPYRSE